MTGPRPCSADEAVARALSLVGKGGQYILGTGDWRPTSPTAPDVPWTTRDGQVGSDCAGFAISWCYKLPRHRPGYNHGPWATVEDDLNSNSALEDAQHGRELFELVTTPAPGVLLLYPTFRLQGHTFIGHVGIVTSVKRCAEWDFDHPPYRLLDVAQCKGPNGRKPAVVATDGSLWEHHDSLWPKGQRRTWMVRALP